jgi:hypothetical protein
MSSLTSQQINNSYQGLIKLEDSTSGLTSSFQTIQDGLGNNLPLKVKDGQIQGQNLFSFGYFVPDYEGTGFTNGSSGVPVAGSQNKLFAFPFYNPGLHSYSAITYSIFTATSTTDVVDVAFYTAQYVDGIGFVPKDLVQSGITWDVSTTGNKTTTLPSTMSFSGYGSGIYFMLLKISNANVTPTVRFKSQPNTYPWYLVGAQLGFTFNASGTDMNSPFKQTTQSGNAGWMGFNTLDFQTSYSSGDFSGQFITTSPPAVGFGLNVIK